MTSLDFQDLLTVLLSTYFIFTVILFIMYITTTVDKDETIDIGGETIVKKAVISFVFILILTLSLILYSLFEIPKFIIQTLSIIGLFTIFFQLSKCYINYNLLNINFRIYKNANNQNPTKIVEKVNELTKVINSYNYLKTDNINLNKKLSNLKEEVKEYTDIFLEEYKNIQREDTEILEENLDLLKNFDNKLVNELSTMKKSIAENKSLIVKSEISNKDDITTALSKISAIESDINEKLSILQKAISNISAKELNIKIEDITKAISILSKEILQLKSNSKLIPINENFNDDKNIKSFENEFTTFNVIQSESSYTEYMKKF